MPAPSLEDLLAKVTHLEERAAAQDLRIAALEAENAELRRKLDSNSRNSSKPPSSDSPFVKPAPKSLRGRSGKKAGGQQGHAGSRLERVAKPDHEVRHEPDACGGCGGDLADRVEIGVEKRQVFDLPPVALEVTEHQIVAKRCTCGHVTSGIDKVPAGVEAPTQYGPRVAAVIVYLYVAQFLSKKRTAQALADLFGAQVSEGTVAAVTKRAAKGTNLFIAQVTDELAGEPVVHFDETGFRVDGKLRWVHSASSGKWSLITVHDKRGTVAMDAADILPRFTGYAVHDAWAPYDTYTDATHVLCNAHLLRELQAVIDAVGFNADPEAPGWCWADQAAKALVKLKTLADAALAIDGTLDALDPEAVAEQVTLLHSAAVAGKQQTKTRSTPVMVKHHALASRILIREADYLAFTRDPNVPFDNNAAEREIRMIKLRQKISGTMRTVTGAEHFCAIRSYLATAAKHGLTHFDALTRLAAGRPWLPEHAMASC